MFKPLMLNYDYFFIHLSDLITFAYLYSKFSSLHPYLKDIILYFYNPFKVLLSKCMTVELKFILCMVLNNQSLLLFNKGSQLPLTSFIENSHSSSIIHDFSCELSHFSAYVFSS